MKHSILIQFATPASHHDTVTGVDNGTNVRLFMRQQMLVNGVAARVPALSENALRSVLFRETLADDLLDRLEIKRGELPQAVVNLIYAGGSMAAGSRAPGDEISLGHAVKKLYPSLDLLGGAVDGFILPRSRLRMAAWLVASEYSDALSFVDADLSEEAKKVSAFDLVAEETRTRGTGSETAGNQMLYTYETLAAGAKALIEISLDKWTPNETKGAVGHALNIWDGYLGGQSRQGRGRANVLRHDLPSADAYLAHIESNKDAMRAGLIDGSFGTGKRLCQ